VAGIGLLSVGVALLAGAALLGAAVLELDGVAELVVATLVLAAAIVVGDSIVLSLLRELTAAALLGAQALWLIGAFWLWRSRGRPRLPALRPPGARAVAGRIRAHPLLAVLVAAAIVALSLQAVLAVTIAPNEYDSLGYHLPRAAFWLQYHSALQYHPGALDDPEQSAPPNAELLVAWTMALTRSDAFAQLVQWIALLGALAAIFCGARLLGEPRARAAFAAGVFALYPEPLLESATAQTDVVLTFFLAAALVFAVSGVRRGRLGRLVVAALAAGLAIGTKLDASFALPAALLILIPSVRAVGPPRRLVLAGLGLALAASVALGSFVYVQNLANTGTLTGFSGTLAGDFVKTNPLADSAHAAWNLLDAPGLPQPRWIARPVQRLANAVFADVHGADFPVPPDPAIREESNEDTSAYGLAGLLLVVPLALCALLRRGTPPARRLLAGGAVGYFLCLPLVIGYSDEEGRLLMPAFALATVLLAAAVRHRWVAVAAVALSLATLPGALLEDVYKPIASSGTPSIFSLDRIDQQTIDDDLAPLGPALHRLDGLVGRHEALGFLQQDNFPEYLLFGEPLQRRLVGFDRDQVTAGALRASGLRALFIGFADQRPCTHRECLGRAAGLRVRPLGGSSYLVTLAAGGAPRAA
jgi:dolichyl-phosphate-mannose-protein mannosyltransferase